MPRRSAAGLPERDAARPAARRPQQQRTEPRSQARGAPGAARGRRARPGAPAAAAAARCCGMRARAPHAPYPATPRAPARAWASPQARERHRAACSRRGVSALARGVGGAVRACAGRPAPSRPRLNRCAGRAGACGGALRARARMPPAQPPPAARRAGRAALGALGVRPPPGAAAPCPQREHHAAAWRRLRRQGLPPGIRPPARWPPLGALPGGPACGGAPPTAAVARAPRCPRRAGSGRRRPRRRA